jgi:hypothetical protein
MRKKIAPIVIIHFQPLELYPPVCNLLNYLAKNSNDRILVVTTKNKKENKLGLYKNTSKSILIKRLPAIVPTSVLRLFQYFFFYANSLRLLLKHQPKSVFYFETLSSWSPLIYKKMKGSKVKLLAHYHEYSSPQEYTNNMFLVKAMHKQEIKMYNDAYQWISQTNEVRLQKMINDHHLESRDQAVFHTMPNYPSKYWVNRKINYGIFKKIRLVYLGSLGYETTYLKQLTNWVIKNKEHFTLDLYSHNIDEKAKDYLGSVHNASIQLHSGINYEELPDVLNKYDIGLVFYKPVSENWIQNAPNKVFEYLACGLDVWFSKTMTYTLSIATEETFPKIIPVDFEKLMEFDFEKAVNREGLVYKESNFFCENVYPDILDTLSK